MGLAIYSEATADTTFSFSQDGDFTSPLLESLDGGDGGSVDKLYYVRNDDSAFSYSGINLSIEDTEGQSIVDGTNGYEWKLSEGATRPTEDEWSLVTAGESIDLPDLGTASASDTSTFLPFWLRITIPKNAQLNTYKDVQLELTATQITV